MRAFRSIPCILARRKFFPGIAVKRFTIMLLVSAAVACQPTYSQTARTQEKSMKHYALVFYPSHTLTPGELKQRQIEILEWAKDVASMGIDLDPRAFGSPLAQLAPSGAVAAPREDGAGSTFTNIVFFDSASEAQAMRVAKTHPGLRYGTMIEVREWTPPRATASTP
jgi:hypothetical protein